MRKFEKLIFLTFGIFGLIGILLASLTMDRKKIIYINVINVFILYKEYFSITLQTCVPGIARKFKSLWLVNVFALRFLLILIAHLL